MIYSVKQADTDIKRSLKASAALCSVSLLVCMLTRNIVSEALWAILPTMPFTDRLVSTLAMAAGFVLMIALLNRAPKKELVKRETDKSLIICLFGMLLCICVISRAVTAVFTDILADLGLKFNAGVMPTDKSEFIVWALSAVVIAPIMEEAAFHKAMLHSLLPYGRKFALVAVTVLFAALHGAPTMWINALLTGGFIGAAVIYTGSVRVGIALHMTNNLIALIESVLLKTGYEDKVLLLGMLMLFIGILSATKLIKTVKPDTDEKDTKDKLKIFFINMPMLIIAAMVILTAKGAAM